ncbi:MAG: hypothetical protein GWP10_14300 [Nitrospiraceae bacterium]|nr:hypothetical protein [Nitrospiraceae bacterium]
MSIILTRKRALREWSEVFGDSLLTSVVWTGSSRIPSSSR